VVDEGGEGIVQVDQLVDVGPRLDPPGVGVLRDVFRRDDIVSA
jgi:hypothetical protein